MTACMLWSQSVWVCSQATIRYSVASSAQIFCHRLYVPWFWNLVLLILILEWQRINQQDANEVDSESPAFQSLSSQRLAFTNGVSSCASLMILISKLSHRSRSDLVHRLERLQRIMLRPSYLHGSYFRPSMISDLPLTRKISTIWAAQKRVE